MRKAAGYTRTDYERNAWIVKGINITPVLNVTQENGRNWLKYIDKQQNMGLKTAGNTITETAGYVRPERFKKWQKSMSAR